MTRRQQRSLAEYVEMLAAALGLGAWQIVLHEGTGDDAHAGSVACVKGRQIAHVNLSDDFLTFAPEEQRHVIVHELIHIHLDRMQQYAEDTLVGMIGGHAWVPWHTAYRDLNEHTTDVLATAFAKTMPLWEGG